MNAALRKKTFKIKHLAWVMKVMHEGFAANRALPAIYKM